MLASGESRKEVVRPDFNQAIRIDFQGAQITADTGFLLLRGIDDRFRIIAPMEECLEDLRSSTHTKHSLIQMVQQRVNQIAAGYELIIRARPSKFSALSGGSSVKCVLGGRPRVWMLLG
ncbi:MAG: transposase [Desulfobaccales bacterium]